MEKLWVVEKLRVVLEEGRRVEIVEQGESRSGSCPAPTGV